MNRFIILIAGALLLLTNRPLFPARVLTTFPRNVPIPLETMNVIDSRATTPFTHLKMRCLKDVIVGNRLVIEKGASAWALVPRVEPAGFFGKKGRLFVELRSIKGVDGQNIYLKGRVDGTWKNKDHHYAMGLGGGLFHHFGTPFLLAGAGIKGFETKVPKGFKFYAYSQRAQKIRAIAPMRKHLVKGGYKIIFTKNAFHKKSRIMKKRAFQSLWISLNELQPSLYEKQIILKMKPFRSSRLPNHLRVGSILNREGLGDVIMRALRRKFSDVKMSYEKVEPEAVSDPAFGQVQPVLAVHILQVD